MPEWKTDKDGLLIVKSRWDRAPPTYQKVMYYLGPHRRPWLAKGVGR